MYPPSTRALFLEAGMATPSPLPPSPRCSPRPYCRAFFGTTTDTQPPVGNPLPYLRLSVLFGGPSLAGVPKGQSLRVGNGGGGGGSTVHKATRKDGGETQHRAGGATDGDKSVRAQTRAVVAPKGPCYVLSPWEAPGCLHRSCTKGLLSLGGIL